MINLSLDPCRAVRQYRTPRSEFTKYRARVERLQRPIAHLEAAGRARTRGAAALRIWDIVRIGSTDVLLVQVKTRDWPSIAEIEAIRRFPGPLNCRKLVHRWRTRHRTPDVREEVANG